MGLLCGGKEMQDWSQISAFLFALWPQANSSPLSVSCFLICKMMICSFVDEEDMRMLEQVIY